MCALGKPQFPYPLTHFYFYAPLEGKPPQKGAPGGAALQCGHEFGGVSSSAKTINK